MFNIKKCMYTVRVSCTSTRKMSCPITLVPVQHIHMGVHVHVCLIHKEKDKFTPIHFATLSFSKHVLPVHELIIRLRVELSLSTCKLSRGYI